MFALVDVNNMYVSCERVFDQRLVGRPVVVLSNNDGACIARSNEAKELGVKMAQPWFQVRHLERGAGLIALSANFELATPLGLTRSRSSRREEAAAGGGWGSVRVALGPGRLSGCPLSTGQRTCSRALAPS